MYRDGCGGPTLTERIKEIEIHQVKGFLEEKT
jgi:hypothetical protein